MGSNKKIRNYSKHYFKGVPPEKKKLIYQAACTMAAGFLSFDSTKIAGTGGGMALLAGRLASLQVAYPWLLTIAAKMLEYLGMYDKETVRKTALAQLNTTIDSDESNEEADFNLGLLDSEMGVNDYTSKDSEVGGNVSTSNSTQKMQILDAKNNVVDFTTLLQDNS